jgi:superfamily II DNA/RNA helicase
MYSRDTGARSGRRPRGNRGGFHRASGASHAPRRDSGPRRGGNRFSHRAFNDVSKFINKVTTTETQEVFVPEHSFADFAVDPRLSSAIAKKGYVTPTPIQDKAIPYILAGRDVVGIANTGTGKTAAFLIPLLHKILTHRHQSVLIMAPTRELAIQIEQEFKGFSVGMPLYSACIVGGAAVRPQIAALRRRPHLVIGTPGRLKDLIDQKCIDCSAFQSVVLDEADRMLDMGFINDMRYIVGKTPADRHTLFFSATLSGDITALISQFLKDPVTVSVKTRDTAKSIDQDVVRVLPGGDKLETLATLLKDKEFQKVLIFGRTKHGAEKLSKELIRLGFAAESIHGNKNHSKRQKALGQFKNNQVTILVATDVAARGLDIPDVSHVINYDLPSTYEDYVHRIGRTGRAGKAGKALTFIEHPQRHAHR